MTENLLKFLIAREGYRKEAYQDTNGYWTIGYGNRYWPDGTKVKKGDVLSSKDEAYGLLRLSVPRYENAMKNAITTSVYNTLNDNQKDALTSLVFNMGPGNFNSPEKGPSTICTLVRNNHNDPKIKEAFGLYNKDNKGEVLPGLVKRRAEEANMYFTPANETYKINGLIEDLSGYVESNTNDMFNGSGNMFDELSHSADWTITQFKLPPTKINNWKNLNSGVSCPKVGDLLFGCHDYHEGDVKTVHDHVAIYLGTHNGGVYIAEGASVRGTNINEISKKVQVAKIENSRFGLNTDVITHFAHCNKVSIEQASLVGLASTNYASVNYNYAPVVGEENMKHFTLIDDRAHRYRPGESSLLWSDTAHSKNISNLPNQEQKQNLVNLVNYLLDPLYEAVEAAGIGKLFVSSGFRSEDLNKEIGGAAESQHKRGQAADIQIKGCKGSAGNALLEVAKLLLTLEKTKGFSYDQMILEEFNSQEDMENLRPVWIHLSYKSKDSNRTYSNGTKLMYWKKGVGYIHIKPEDVLSKPIS